MRNLRMPSSNDMKGPPSYTGSGMTTNKQQSEAGSVSMLERLRKLGDEGRKRVGEMDEVRRFKSNRSQNVRSVVSYMVRMRSVAVKHRFCGEFLLATFYRSIMRLLLTPLLPSSSSVPPPYPPPPHPPPLLPPLFSPYSTAGEKGRVSARSLGVSYP